MKSAINQEVREIAPTSKLQRQQSSGRRLNIILPEKTFRELKTLAKESNRTMTELLRLAIGLAHIATVEESHGRKLAVVDHEGRLVKELVLLR